MTTGAKTNLDWRMLVLTACVAIGTAGLFLVPRLLGSGARQTAEYQANRERIKNMTAIERERVLRRADRFFDMSEEEQSRIRNLHKDLQNDPEAEKLRAVMTRYNEWLASLSVYEREDLRSKLRKAKSPAEMSQLIAQTKEQKEVEREVPRSVRTAWRKERDPKKWTKMPDPLDPGQLDTVTAFLEGRLQLTDRQKSELQSLPAHRRHVRVATMAMEKHNEQRFPGRSRILDDSALRPHVEREIQDDALRKRLLTAMQSRWFRHGFMFLVARSIFAERRTVRGEPTDQELEEFVKSLDEEKQKELMRSRGSDHRRTLERMYYNGGEDSKEFEEFRNQWTRLMWRRFPRKKSSRPNGGRFGKGFGPGSKGKKRSEQPMR